MPDTRLRHDVEVTHEPLDGQRTGTTPADRADVATSTPPSLSPVGLPDADTEGASAPAKPGVDDPALAPGPDPTTRHTLAENVLGVLTGVFLASFGLFLLTESGAVSGGTAGLALLLSYATSWTFGVLFLAVNLPFFVLAVWKKGWAFTLRTVLTVSMLSAFSYLHPVVFRIDDLDPVYGTLGGNLLVGVGLLILFRHGASLGGINILALVLQERLGLRTGYVQMAFDVLIVALSLTVVAWPVVLLSALGAVVLNLVLAMNHKEGRYLGRT